MRRITFVLAVAAIVAASMAFSGIALAQGQSETAPNCEKGIAKTLTNPGFDNRSVQANFKVADQGIRCLGVPTV